MVNEKSIYRTTSWHRSRLDSRQTDDPRVISNQQQQQHQQQGEGVILTREMTGGTRISPNTIDRVFDNSNRRQYGMGIVGKFFGLVIHNIYLFKVYE